MQGFNGQRFDVTRVGRVTLLSAPGFSLSARTVPSVRPGASLVHRVRLDVGAASLTVELASDGLRAQLGGILLPRTGEHESAGAITAVAARAGQTVRALASSPGAGPISLRCTTGLWRPHNKAPQPYVNIFVTVDDPAGRAFRCGHWSSCMRCRRSDRQPASPHTDHPSPFPVAQLCSGVLGWTLASSASSQSASIVPPS